MMDNFEGKDPQSRRNAIERDISRLSMEIGVVDRKVRYYLADRSQNPHPRHLDLIEKIQRYRIDPTVSNRHLETLLENLQWKIFYYQQSWRQMWENAENARGRRQASEPASSAGASGRPDMGTASEEAQSAAERKDPPRRSSQYSLDHLWSIQQEKITSYGAAFDETRSAFNARIAREYKQLSAVKKNGQEIVMTFDPVDKKCRLNLKDGQSGP
jgi:hypothetical protein